MARSPEIAVALAALLTGVPVWLAGCGPSDSDQAAARALLDRVAALDLRAPPAHRARQLDALRALDLHPVELHAARDRCAVAHGGLLTAELQQAAVQARLERNATEPVQPSELPALRDALARASSDLAEARAALPSCVEAVRAATRRLR